MRGFWEFFKQMMRDHRDPVGKLSVLTQKNFASMLGAVARNRSTIFVQLSLQQFVEAGSMSIYGSHHTS